MPAVNLVQVACYVRPAQAKALRALSARTRVPMQVYMREAVDDVLRKYRRKK
jgi:hypothetical protein